MKVKYQNGDIVTDEGPWFDSVRDAALDRVSRLEAQLPAAQREVEAALILNDPYRGGGVFELARLLNELGSAKSQVATADRLAKIRGKE